MPAVEWWARLRARLGGTRNGNPAAAQSHVAQTSEALRALLEDQSIPNGVRRELDADFAQVEALLEKLAAGELHIAVFGRVSVRVCALGNAVRGRNALETGVLHGTTRARRAALAGSR